MPRPSDGAHGVSHGREASLAGRRRHSRGGGVTRGAGGVTRGREEVARARARKAATLVRLRQASEQNRRDALRDTSTERSQTRSEPPGYAGRADPEFPSRTPRSLSRNEPAASYPAKDGAAGAAGG